MVRTDPAMGREGGGDLGERIAGLQALGAEQVGGQVAIAEPEPALAPEAGQFLHDRPALSHDAPAGLPIVHAGQRVRDGVQVGTDMETVQDRVVTHVDDRGQGGRGDDLDEAGKHAGGSNTAAEGDKHGASIEGAARRADRRARLPSPFATLRPRLPRHVIGQLSQEKEHP
jgi:hypothetical protein